MNTSVASVLSHLMNGMSEAVLSEKTNVPKATINRLLSGRTPDPRGSTLTQIAQYFDISVEQLIGIKPLPKISSLTHNLKLSGKIAIVPIIEEMEIESWINKKFSPKKYSEILLNKEHIHSDKIYIVQLKNQMMLPKFSDDSFLIVDPEAEEKTKDFVIYKVDNSIFLRQLIIEKNNKYLVSLNFSKQPIKIEKKDVFLGVILESKIYLR